MYTVAIASRWAVNTLLGFLAWRTFLSTRGVEMFGNALGGFWEGNAYLASTCWNLSEIHWIVWEIHEKNANILGFENAHAN